MGFSVIIILKTTKTWHIPKFSQIRTQTIVTQNSSECWKTLICWHSRILELWKFFGARAGLDPLKLLDNNFLYILLKILANDH